LGYITGSSGLNEEKIESSSGVFTSKEGVLKDYKGDASIIVVPEGIVEIGKYFAQNNDITKISLPVGITKLDYGAFINCVNLLTVELPDSLSSLGDYAFNGCSQLTDFVMPPSLKKMGYSALGGCINLESIALPDGINEIEKHAFSFCTKLKNVTLPPSLKKIGAWAFICCENLEAISFPDGINQIEKYAFGGCVKLKNITLPHSLRKIDYMAFSSCKNLEAITFPDGINQIEDFAFNYCTQLKNITLPRRLRKIGIMSFGNCENLESILIPDGIKEIEDTAFWGCPKLKNIVLATSLIEIGYCIYLVNGKLILGKDGSYTEKGAKETVIKFEQLDKKILVVDNKQKIASIQEKSPTSAVNIKAHFQEIKEVKIKSSSGVFTSKNGIFIDYEGDTSVIVVPDGIVEISNYFTQNTNMTKISLPEGIMKLDNSAFQGCVNLRTVQLPKSLSSIGDFAFQTCRKLTDISLPHSLTEIAEGVFDGCKNLESISLPDGITEIGRLAFNGCKKLKNITLPHSLKKIGNSAFGDCQNLESISLPSGIIEIGGAFGNCKKLKNITLPHGLKKMDGLGTFYGCENLETISLPEGINEIGMQTFGGCVKLKNITLPHSVRKISYMAFSGCKNLESITFLEGINEIDNSAFINCTGLKNITLPQSLRKIGNRSFGNCENLESIFILGGGGIIEIEESAFEGCTNLKNITLPSNLIEIGYSAFLVNGKRISCQEGSSAEILTEDTGIKFEQAEKEISVDENKPIPIPVQEKSTAYDGETKAHRPGIKKENKKMTDEERFETKNEMAMENAAKIDWCYCMKAAKPMRTLDVHLNNGRTYQYLSKYIAEVNDLVVIDDGATYSQMGIVQKCEEGSKISVTKSVRIRHVFTPKSDSTTIKSLVKELKNLAKVKAFLISHSAADARQLIPATVCIKRLLIAVSILAHPDKIESAILERCKKQIQIPIDIPAAFLGIMLGLSEGEGFKIAEDSYCGPAYDVEIETMLDGEPDNYHTYVQSYEVTVSDTYDIAYTFESCEKEVANLGINVYASVTALLIRGGFTNLMAAFLSVKPQIQDILPAMITLAEKLNSNFCLAQLKEYEAKL